MVSDRVSLFLFFFFFLLVHLPHVSSQPTSFSTYAHTHTMYLLAMVRQSSVISRRMTGLSRILRSNDTDCLPFAVTFVPPSYLPTGTYHTSISVAWCRSLVCISHNHHHLLPLPVLLLLLLLLLILFVPFFAYRRHLCRRRLQPRTLWVDHSHAPPQDTSRIDRALHSCILL